MKSRPAVFDRAALRERLQRGVNAMAGQGAQSVTLLPDQIERLLDYLALLHKWNAVYNLTAVRDPAEMVTQHLLDSLSAAFAFATARRVLDVGAGGGLPGIVLAIWAAHANPAMEIHLVDTVHKKTAFLTQVKAELGLDKVTVHTGRVEALTFAEPFDVITSRAFAEMADFVRLAGRLLAPHGRMLAMKGVYPNDELAYLPAGWRATSVLPLSVPGLDAERHLVALQSTEGGAA